MSSMDSHLKIALESIPCFTDDGTLDISEVNYLLGIAKADGTIDVEEKRVLLSILDKVSAEDVDDGTWRRIEATRRTLGAQAWRQPVVSSPFVPSHQEVNDEDTGGN